ncbi:hypothetical protein J1N35_005502 [Gossypium stocksii]|uniref:Uncharacterized protein n=1 Tax=Gossypium stocksii TaxID=47602 RepID=A0A9D4AH61_9ROSI|nr:hypothetical protein J1N35_005502 [Gossypium stocksii]
MKEKENESERREKEFEKEKENESEYEERKEKKCEQEKQIETKSKNDFSKKISEKDEKKQEKISVILTNLHVPKNPCDEFQLQYLPDERRFHLIEKGKVEDEIKLQVLKGEQGKESLATKSRQSGLKVVNKIFDDLVFKRSSYFDLEHMFKLCITIPKVLSSSSSMLSLTFFIFVKVCDDGKFFASKWPNLRTNRLQEGGYDTNLVASCYDTTRRFKEWPKLEGPKCKMKLNYKLIQLNRRHLQFIAS